MLRQTHFRVGGGHGGGVKLAQKRPVPGCIEIGHRSVTAPADIYIYAMRERRAAVKQATANGDHDWQRPISLPIVQP
jgi:hypothetical protein